MDNRRSKVDSRRSKVDSRRSKVDSRRIGGAKWTIGAQSRQ